MVLGVSSSIAIYKSCDLVRELTKQGNNITVILTPEAARWIAPVVWSTLSGNPAWVHEGDHPVSMAHIELRKNCDLFLVAPATANTIGKLAHGIADNLLTTFALAYSGPKYIAPSMNPHIYSAIPVQKNLELLGQSGYKIIAPETGEAVCGDQGTGKMASLDTIILEIAKK